jgi:hypothetical protein
MMRDEIGYRYRLNSMPLPTGNSTESKHGLRFGFFGEEINQLASRGPHGEEELVQVPPHLRGIPLSYLFRLRCGALLEFAEDLFDRSIHYWASVKTIPVAMLVPLVHEPPVVWKWNAIRLTSTFQAMESLIGISAPAPMRVANELLEPYP